MEVGDTWRLRPGQTLQYRQWDDEVVLYNDLSGDTHLLDEPAIAVLLALAARPLRRPALVAALEAQFDLDDLDPDAETAALLEHLQRLHLVDTVAC